jgi:hypothetical protein
MTTSNLDNKFNIKGILVLYKILEK